MQRPIKVGILSPYSSIYPNLSHDFVDGLMSGLPDDYGRQIELVPEYIGQGRTNAIIEASNKLLSFHNVDIISGFASYRVLPEIVKPIEDRNRLGFFADMGEYIPYTDHISDNIFFNSLQFWQAEYALGFWAQKQFDGRGTMVMSIYEAGYQMHCAFREGYFMAGAQEIETSIIPQNRASREVMLEYFKEFITKFKKEKPAFLHALFSGTEAIDFIGLYYEHGLHKEVPLILTPHMASEEVLMGIKGVNTSIYGASLWDRHEENRANDQFKKRVLQRTGLLTNTPTLLGYEIGLALTGVFKQLQRREISEVSHILKEQRLTTPRGERSFYLDSEYSTPKVEIEKITLSGIDFRKLAIEEGRSLRYDHLVFQRMHEENVSGWLNPYLCV